MEEKHIWAREDGESEQEFTLFEAYKNTYRDIPAMVDVFYPDAPRQSSRIYLNQIAKDHSWKKRVAAFDRWIGKQRDMAVAEMVKNEAALVGKYRIEFLRDLRKKAKVVGRKLQAKLDDESDKELHVGALSTYTYIVKAILDEYAKLEKSNPLEATPEEPFAGEKLGAQDKLMALIARNARKIEPGIEDGSALLQ